MSDIMNSDIRITEGASARVASAVESDVGTIFADGYDVRAVGYRWRNLLGLDLELRTKASARHPRAREPLA